MTNDLNNSVFFDGRTITFISKLLYSPGGKISPLSALEIKLAEKQNEIQELNSTLDGQLIKILSDSKGYISVPNSIMFLLRAQKMNLLDDAVMTLEFAAREERSLSAKNLIELIQNSHETPIAWGLSLLGDETDDRYSSSAEIPEPSINLSKLRDFK